MYPTLTQCYCTRRWHSVIALDADTVLLHSTLTQSYCTRRWHSVIALNADTVLLHSTLTQCYCTRRWHSAIALNADTVLLHSTLTQCCFNVGPANIGSTFRVHAVECLQQNWENWAFRTWLLMYCVKNIFPGEGGRFGRLIIFFLPRTVTRVTYSTSKNNNWALVGKWMTVPR